MEWKNERWQKKRKKIQFDRMRERTQTAKNRIYRSQFSSNACENLKEISCIYYILLVLKVDK